MGVIVKLFAIMESTMQHVANATVADSHKPGSTVRRELHGHPLDQTGGKDLIVITKSNVLPGKADVPYPYTFLGAEEPPATLGGMFSAGFYVWDTRHMVPQDTPPSTNPPQAPAPSPSPSDAGAGPSKRKEAPTAEVGDSLPARKRHKPAAEDEDEVVAVPLTDDMEVGTEVETSTYGPEQYLSVRIRVKLSQVDVPSVTLRTVDEDHVEALSRSFTERGYDYDKGTLMSVTVRREDNQSLPSLDVGALTNAKTVKAAGGVSHTALYLKEDLKSITVDGVHRRESLAKLMRSRSTNDSLSWLDEELEMMLKVRKDGQDMKSSEILHHGARDNNLASNVRAMTEFPDMVYALKNYALCPRTYALWTWPRNWRAVLSSVRSHPPRIGATPEWARRSPSRLPCGMIYGSCSRRMTTSSASSTWSAPNSSPWTVQASSSPSRL